MQIELLDENSAVLSGPKAGMYNINVIGKPLYKLQLTSESACQARCIHRTVPFVHCIVAETWVLGTMQTQLCTCTMCPFNFWRPPLSDFLTLLVLCSMSGCSTVPANTCFDL